MIPHRKYLLIIDEAPISPGIEDYFSKFDFKIVHQTSINPANLTGEPPEALLINWRILESGDVSISSLFHHYKTPIIVLSDAPNEEMCVKMLESGADDFLIKPVHPRELHARISAISRRVQRALAETEHEKEVLVFANWRLYPASRKVIGENNEELQLSAGEYDLLLAFVRQPHRVLGREFLLQITKCTDLNPLDRRIDVQISRLRQKIETDAKKPALIKTIRNGGYLFTSKVLTLKENTNS